MANARIADQRSDAIHKLTTRLAKTHGTIVVETLNVSGMLAQKHFPRVRRRRRDLADASMSEIRRQLTYKCGWYGSELVEAEATIRRPDSATCVESAMSRAGTESGPAPGVAVNTTATTTRQSISPAIPRATRAQLVPPTGVEPSVRSAAADCWL